MPVNEVSAGVTVKTLKAFEMRNIKRVLCGVGIYV
jgi:hypothetical protein